MVKISKFLSNSIVQFIGGSGVVAAVTWIVGLLRGIELLYIWAVFLLTMGCTIWIIFQIKGRQETHKKGFSSLTSEQMEDTLRKWLDKRGYSLTHKTSDGCLFYFTAEDIQGRPINIYRQEINPQVIILMMIVNEDVIKNLPEPTQKMIKNAVALDMARFGMLWSPDPMFYYIEIPCDDSLDEHVFVNAVNKVRQATIIAQLVGQYHITEYILNEAEKQSELEAKEKADRDAEAEAKKEKTDKGKIPNL